MGVTQRQLARDLGLSLACVSMALADNPAISAATRLRVKTHAEAAGYRADPFVSEGMSRISRRTVFREVLHVIGDVPLDRQGPRALLWESLNRRAEHLGYHVDYRCLNLTNPDAIARWHRVAHSRGVRGVFIYPLSQVYASIKLKWSRHVWVAIGDSLRYPDLHRSGRDYVRDTRRALTYLGQRGCRRIGFANFWDHEARVGYPLLQASALQNQLQGGVLKRPFHDITSADQSELLVWSRKERLDGMVLGFDGDHISKNLRAWLKDHPHAFLAAPDQNGPAPAFWPNYEMIGQEAVNLMHRMIASNGFGIPVYEQTVLSTSRWLGETGIPEPLV
ncbi:MAG: transcriptional regulator [Rariglobus sp.]|jgi:DNA-binding LacI/PurR family transcriptional regulator|nr:transcriptional regulator [Rariglobus sp.]